MVLPSFLVYLMGTGLLNAGEQISIKPTSENVSCDLFHIFLKKIQNFHGLDSFPFLYLHVLFAKKARYASLPDGKGRRGIIF
jgi:hypothetical protein